MKNRIFYIFLCCSIKTLSQDTANTHLTDTSFSAISLQSLNRDNEYNKKRIYLVSGVHVGFNAGTIFILGQTWYKDYPKTSFHVFNDSKEWLQVDKAGHAWTAYSLANASKSLWSWAGLPRKKAVWLGVAGSISYLTILEFFDAHSAKWGWSWADMGTNVLGSGLYAVQEFSWKEQRIQFKFSAHKIKYDAALMERADELYGRTLPERLLKDYNGQTYWLSANVKSFSPQSTLPAWLNIAVGYGASGMFGGFENIGFDKDGVMNFNRTDIERLRQWYLSPDVDFTKIKTNKKGVRLLLSFLNVLKLPAPTVAFSDGKIKGYWLYF